MNQSNTKSEIQTGMFFSHMWNLDLVFYKYEYICGQSVNTVNKPERGQ